MSEAKFTKGDWRVERFVNDKGFEISFNDDGEVVAEYVYTKPDAHLIAAAPEMYEMLEYFDNLLGMLDEYTHPSVEIDCQQYEIRKLLAKARGE